MNSCACADRMSLIALAMAQASAQALRKSPVAMRSSATGLFMFKWVQKRSKVQEYIM